MSLRIARLLFIVVLIFTAGLTLFVLAERKKVQLLQSRATEFYEHIVNGEYDELWDMASPSIKRDTPKAEYVIMVERFLETMEFNYETPKIADRRGNYGATIAEIIVVSEDVGGQACEKTLWVWRDHNWYFFKTNLVCEYEPGKREIKRHLEY